MKSTPEEKAAKWPWRIVREAGYWCVERMDTNGWVLLGGAHESLAEAIYAIARIQE
jgi:hypothetical protein